MIKVKTLIRFTDGKDKVREVNDEFEISQKRLDEILAVGKLVKVVQEKKKKKSGD